MGWGMAVPDRVLTNGELSALVETSDEWIRQRTGIVERRIAAEGETTSSLSFWPPRPPWMWPTLIRPPRPDHRGHRHPDHSFPATACLVQDGLGARAAAFDLSAGCSGFVYGLSLAADLLAGAAIKRLVIGAETLSRIPIGPTGAPVSFLAMEPAPWCSRPTSAGGRPVIGPGCRWLRRRD